MSGVRALCLIAFVGLLPSCQHPAATEREVAHFLKSHYPLSDRERDDVFQEFFIRPSDSNVVEISRKVPTLTKLLPGVRWFTFQALTKSGPDMETGVVAAGPALPEPRVFWTRRLFSGANRPFLDVFKRVNLGSDADLEPVAREITYLLQTAEYIRPDEVTVKWREPEILAIRSTSPDGWGGSRLFIRVLRHREIRDIWFGYEFSREEGAPRGEGDVLMLLNARLPAECEHIFGESGSASREGQGLTPLLNLTVCMKANVIVRTLHHPAPNTIHYEVFRCPPDAIPSDAARYLPPILNDGIEHDPHPMR